jgi:small-conductance mechanosensitive channel
MIDGLLSFVEDPRLQALLAAAILLAVAYVVARLVSWLVGRILVRAARRTPTPRDDELVAALKRSLTRSVFLLGAMPAAVALPVAEHWHARLLQAVVALWIVVTTLAFIRGWKLGLAWTGHEKDGTAKAWSKDFGPLLSKVGAVALGLFGLIALLRSFDVDVNSLVVSLGVGSLAVGLAAQDTLANMFAGFTLMLDRPFVIGDRIRLASGETGDVVEIGIRATRVRTLDDTIVVVPNSLLTKERVANLSRPTRSVTTRAEVGIAYGSDLDEAKGILAAAARRSRYADPTREPVVLVTRFGDFAVNLLVVFWARDYAEQGLALSEVYETIYRELARAGIEIPYPVQRQIQEAAAAPPPPARAPREERS